MSSKVKIDVATVAKYFSSYADTDKNGVVSEGDELGLRDSCYTLSKEDVSNSWKLAKTLSRISNRHFKIFKEWHGSRRELFLIVSKENDPNTVEAQVDIGYLRKVKQYLPSGHDKPDHEV